MTTAHDKSALALLHCRLEEHFIQLSNDRDVAAPGMPVFALEHDLSEAELALLRDEVLKAVGHGLLPHDLWLPFVVYTAEIGYEFSGDEYWQTFEARTPGWIDLGDPARQYIRNKYREFRDAFSGAEPSGRWADHFSIICWPITHAVLPTDLQRHLARLLFDFRRLLTADTLNDPEELGRRLAARAWQASARFQTFAQNTRLLGQVAAALLAGEDDESPYLVQSTQTRIVGDLSKERHARRWLKDAKSTAHQVRTRGFRTFSQGQEAAQGSGRESASTDPKLFLRKNSDGWSLYIELPDFSALPERLPIMSDELASLRPRVNGVSRRFAVGHLLYPGQQVRATTWPRRDSPLVQLENGSEVVNELLADQCAMSRGPVWLFRMQAASFSVEVRGKFVRPGHEYVLVSDVPRDADLPEWATVTGTATEGIHAYRLTTPERFDDVVLTAIRTLDLAGVMDVEVRPVGYVPVSWDGEGAAEWLEGEQPLIAVRSSRSVAQCILTVDNIPALLPWPEDSDELFVRLEDLRPGSHTVHVALIPPEAGAPVAEGSLDVTVRSPVIRPPTGSPREGLMILASPARPTLEDLWNERGYLELIGPTQSRARVALELTDRQGRSLVRRSNTLTLRVDRARWADFFVRQFRQAEDVHRKYEQAEACVVTVSVPGLGAVSIQCERAFTPLRWAFGRDDQGPYVALIDNTDGRNFTTTRFDFSTPNEGRIVSTGAGQPLRWPEGGLVHATDGLIHASVVLPPRVRTLEDLHRMREPELGHLGRTKRDVSRVIELAQLWATASLPADPFAAVRRLIVLRAIARALASTIGGERWTQAELAAQREASGLWMLGEAIGDKPEPRELAGTLRSEMPTLESLDLDGRIAHFGAILRVHGHAAPEDQDVVSEFLLRLATEPSTLLEWHEGHTDELLSLTLSLPVVLRAARFVVLATAAGLPEDAGSVYPGWLWE